MVLNQHQAKSMNSMLRLLRHCFAIGLLLFTVACEKPFMVDQPSADGEYNQLVSEAKTYYEVALTTDNARLGSSSQQKGKLEDKKPNWEQAVTFNIDGRSVVEVPLLYGAIDPVYTIKSKILGGRGNITQPNGVTKALFFKQKDGSLKAYVMKLILQSEYLQKLQKNEHKKISFGKLKGSFSGTVLLLNWNEQLLDIYQYEKGKIVACSKQSTNSSKNGRRICYYAPKCENVCVGSGQPCCTMEESAYNPTGWCCAWGYSTCYYSCVYDEVCYPDDNPNEPCNSCDPNNGTPATPTTVDITVDPNLNDCFKGVIGNVTAEGLKNYMSRTIQSVFGNNNGATNLTFRAGSADGSIGGFDESSSSIILDASKLNTQSNEFIAAVVFHEMAHVIIVQYRGSFLSPSTYDQHVQIFQTMINNMKRVVATG